jgi:formylglycine-generating enzyme required for sulfatase activity
VSYDMAAAYCKSKNARLPTETEWEYAARGPVQHDYPWGDEAPDEKRLNAAGTEYRKWDMSAGGEGKTMFAGEDGYVGTAPVGQFPGGKSGYGVYDLAGNVWEWTSDFYGPHAAGELKDPKGPPTGTERAIRGGAFNGWDPAWANPAWRYRYVPGTYSHALGFRCAADAK